MTEHCIIFDIDGTIADCSHRLPLIRNKPKQWDAFFLACKDDSPIEHMLSVLRALRGSFTIVYVTARPERSREDTEYWLWRQTLGTHPDLYMRADGDRRPDDEVKLDLLKQIRADGFEPLMAFEDRTRVVEMWRRAGVPCAQVAPGDY